MYDKIAEPVKVRSKYSWYQYGEKSTKIFVQAKKEK